MNTNVSSQEIRNAGDTLLATRKALFPHMTDMYFDVLIERGLGLPDQYSGANAHKWAMRVLRDFATLSNKDGHIIRLACIRFRCVKCRLPCEDVEEGKPIDDHSPYVFPCGHIIGSSCYKRMILAHRDIRGSPICP